MESAGKRFAVALAHGNPVALAGKPRRSSKSGNWETVLRFR